jgi:uncharacterized membrane protein
MQNCKSSARTAAQQSSKSPLLFRPAALAAILLLAAVLSGCGGKDTIYVWNMKDIIGLWVFGILVVVIALIFLYAWVADKIDSRKRKRKQSQHSS